MSLTTPSSVQKLQTALHAKAKESPDFRFYALYEKVYRRDVLAYAYERCKANGGAAGVDNQTFESIEQYGAERWLDELAQELKSQTYQPQPVRRVYIPKPDGKQRPLGIPTIRDRAVQTAAVLVLEPIFEADLQPEQYAYRADRSALDAVQRVHKLINTGHGQIVDADLSSYFDSVPHAELMRSVARRVVDGAMLHLIKMWLEAPVEETDERGNKHRSTRNRDEGRGTPQGSPISPLLSNLYMRRFVLGWKKLGHEERWKAYIVNYADDLVICCRVGAERALAEMRTMMSKLKLTMNESKTRVCYLRYVSDLRTGRINPQHFKFDLSVEQKKYDLAQFLRDRIMTTSELQAVLDEVEPPFAGYRRTEQALTRFAEDDGCIPDWKLCPQGSFRIAGGALGWLSRAGSDQSRDYDQCPRRTGHCARQRGI